MIIIVVSLIIGFNIVSLIDKKINNISVNVPPFKVPEPKVVVKMCENFDQISKNKEDKENKENKENKEDKKDNNKVDPLKPNNFDGELNEIAIERGYKDRTPSDLNNPEKDDIVNYVEDDDEQRPLNQTKHTMLDKANRLLKLQGMDEVDDIGGVNKIWDYDGSGARPSESGRYIDAGDFGYQLPRVMKACQNSSISQKFISGKNKIKPFQTACNQRNGLTAENYYKTHFETPRLWLEDYKTLGYNYSDYDKSANPYNTKYKILPVGKKAYKPEKNRYIPQAKNYVFGNSPALNTNIGGVVKRKRPPSKSIYWDSIAEKIDNEE
ncbi:MAG: hypothetical protein CMF62_00950 [Magnetococcales bacterium]|nr:hypothetical protein [Magnetococcales bacterium]